MSSAGVRLLDVVPRSRWLSAAGGVSVAYVFMHLLPELAEGQAAIEGEEGGAEAEDAAPGPVFGFLEHHASRATASPPIEDRQAQERDEVHAGSGRPARERIRRPATRSG